MALMEIVVPSAAGSYVEVADARSKLILASPIPAVMVVETAVLLRSLKMLLAN